MVGKYTCHGLTQDGFDVEWIQDGQAAESSIRAFAYQAVILDLGLPSKDGLAVLASIRAAGNDVPVLVLTGRDTAPERIAGLNAGADDYLAKPFDLDELIARLRALIRRHERTGLCKYTSGELVLNPGTKSVTLRGTPVDLSSREFAILQELMRKPGFALSREALEHAVYSRDEKVRSNAIEVHLHHLRKKLGAGVIKNIRGVGYRVHAA